MQATKVHATMLILLLALPLPLFHQKRAGMFINGYSGYDANYSTAADVCTSDAALQFIGCHNWISKVPSDYNYRGTVVVIDDGLCVDQWKALENKKLGFAVDVVKYLTPLKNIGTQWVTAFGDYGTDDLSNIDNSLLNCREGEEHGFRVISSLATVLPYVKVIFVNAEMNQWSNDGFVVYKNKFLWEWLKDNVERYDIDVITMSLSYPDSVAGDTSEIDRIISEIYNKGVFMVTSIGNDGIYEGDAFPNRHPYFYAIGSVDHEDRAAYVNEVKICYDGRKWTYCKSTTYRSNGNSWKGHYTGEAPVSTYKSSYGSMTVNHAEAMDFVMPGHGVPLASFVDGKWKYAQGTSFSTPYLAAAALVAIFAYNLGFRANRGYEVDPSPSVIYSLLKDSASSIIGSWHYRYGWGHVTLTDLYDNAYAKGYVAGSQQWWWYRW